MYKFCLESVLVLRYIIKLLIANFLARYILRLQNRSRTNNIYLCLLLIFPLLHVCATGKAQGITIKKKEVSLVDVFRDIRKQTDYDFIYTDKQISTSKKVDIDVDKASIKEVLDKCFANQPLTYKIRDKTITIETRPKPLIEQTAVSAPLEVYGKVTDEVGNPLVGAGVSAKGFNKTTLSNSQGEFTLRGIDEGTILLITYMGYETKEVAARRNVGSLTLTPVHGRLEVVEIVNTGYQSIPKERATGSFVTIGNELLNRSVSPNILDRLDGVTSGLIFNKGLNISGNPSDISIRGRSTLFANPNPFIVLDNFPYDGDITNIDPNDVESITVLKDAAAASIWGVRAGNGVIVITTKKGTAQSKVKIGINATTTVSDEIDLYYKPQMSSSEYIELERFLFDKGNYNSAINTNRNVISPAVAIMLQKRNGQIYEIDAENALSRLKTIDVRRDLQRYIYQKEIVQQYSTNFNGAGKNYNFYISAGLVKNRGNLRGIASDRLSLNANHTIKLLNDKLEVGTGLLFAQNDSQRSNRTYTMPYVPYEELIDSEGNPLSVVRSGGLRKQYTDTAGRGQLLNWDYIPLNEIAANENNRLTDYKFNINLTYKVLSGLQAALNYQFQKGVTDGLQTNTLESFHTRNIINSFTQANSVGQVVAHPVPIGEILGIRFSEYNSNNGRFQLNYTKSLAGRHEINLLAGSEVKDYQSTNRRNTIYGYNPSDASSVPVNHQIDYQQFDATSTGRIAGGGTQDFAVDRFVSFYFNGSYMFDRKYVLSASARRDEANIFGVSANQKGVPLWSLGFLWNLSKEAFYTLPLLSELKLRTSYGFNGNVDKTTSAYLTARSASGRINEWNMPYIEIINPPNPALSWEKVKNFNVAIDFIFKNNLISGSLDYFQKSGLDLIGNGPIAPQTGVVQFKGNSANTRTQGIDLILNKNAIGLGKFKWNSTFLFNYSKEIVTRYKVKLGSNSTIVNNNHTNPLEGYPYFSIFSLPNMGLNESGFALGRINGQTTNNYTTILNNLNPDDLQYHGSATPLFFGSFRNTFSYGNFDLSFNIIYKLDYYFRRFQVFSGSNYSYTLSDFDKRWQKPGDESKTRVPGLVYP
ncbi:MAG: SusC/RagA family TonB-linked outer membrane protein, partial [Flavobacterium sp.]